MELLDNINQEVEVLKSVYSDYELVLQEPALSDDSVSLVLDIRPAIGIDDAKNGLLAHLKLEFG